MDGNKQSTSTSTDKKMSLKAVRQFMKLGRSRSQSGRRDSSTEDENR